MCQSLALERIKTDTLANPTNTRVPMQMDEAAAVMTQLPPDRAHPLVATLVSGEMLGSFSVQAYDCCGARSGSCASLACTLQVACEGLDPTKASFPIDAAGRATAEGERLQKAVKRVEDSLAVVLRLD